MRLELSYQQARPLSKLHLGRLPSPTPSQSRGCGGEGHHGRGRSSVNPGFPPAPAPAAPTHAVAATFLGPLAIGAPGSCPPAPPPPPGARTGAHRRSDPRAQRALYFYVQAGLGGSRTWRGVLFAILYREPHTLKKSLFLFTANLPGSLGSWGAGPLRRPPPATPRRPRPEPGAGSPGAGAAPRRPRGASSCRVNGPPSGAAAGAAGRGRARPRRPPPPSRGGPRRALRHSAARGRQPERRWWQERNLPT